MLAWRVAVIAVVVGAVGCRPAPAAQPQGASAAVQLARHVPLSLGVAATGKSPAIPLPNVAATVAGRPVTLLVDTGAASHVLASWLVKAARISVAPAVEHARDVAGRTTDTHVARHPRIAIAGLGDIPDVPAIVLELPPGFEAAGIGGLVSPQWLAGKGQVAIVDLPAGVMSVVATSEAASMARAGATLVASAPPCGNPAAAFPNETFTVPAVIGGVAARLSIDTGADETRVHAGSAAGRALAAGAAPAGRDLSATSAAGVEVKRGAASRLTIGDFTTTLAPLLVEGESPPDCPTDGVLGMDVLRACQLIVNPAGLTARCGPTGQRSPALPRR